MSTGTTAAPATPPVQSSPSRGGSGTARGGRGGRQPRGEGQNRSRNQDGQRPRRGGRGGGGRQGQGRGAAATDAAKDSNAPAAVKPAPISAIPTSANDGEEDEGEVCFICASPIVHHSVAPCNHRTCHICSLRLRALYKTRACAHCRTESPFVIFTDDETKRYEDYLDTEFDRVDDALGIKYEKQEIFDDTILLLRYNCPDQDCDIACYGWPDLHRHVRSIHHKVMCDLCTRHKKVFTHEHELYTQGDLRKHERYGDDNPGSIEQTGFKGHPECGFCRQRFYGDDELYVHCREKHERCHICDRRGSGRSQQYYINYDSLEAHFRKDHFLCPDKECLEKKFVVFDSELDIKAHQLEQHPNGMSKDVRREARMVDMSTFDFRAPHQEERRRGGRGRGRDPNAEPIPASSAQPLRRDELAFQRQLAIHSAQSTTTRTFGGQLTSTRPQPQAAAAPAASTARLHPAANGTSQAAPPANRSVDAPPASTENTNTQQAFDPRTEARRLQHQAVMDRASTLLHNDASKLASFRGRVSAYQHSTTSANDLVETFFSLFDAPAAELGTLIKELADIYENDDKRAGLLKAWNDWRAINEDYPTLPGPTASGSAAVPATGSGGRRVLKLKSASAQSGRGAEARQATWTNLPSFARPAGGAGGVAFPSLPAGAAGGRKAGTPTPWAGAAGGSGSTTGSARASPAPGRQGIAPPPSAVRGADAFPELPKATKPNTHMAGLHRGNVLWQTGSSTPKVSAWSGSSGNAAADVGSAELDAEASGAGKKKKKGKEVLYKFG